MIRSFYEFPLLELLQVFGVGVLLFVVGSFVCGLAFFVFSLITGNLDLMENTIERVFEGILNHSKKALITFFSLVMVFSWLILDREISDDEYKKISEMVTQKNSLAVTQQLYKIAVADKKISYYEQIFIEYNEEKLRKKLSDERKEAEKRVRIESTIKKIDSINPS